MVVYHFGRLLQVYDVDLVPLLLSTVLDLFNNYRIKEFLISATIRNSETFVTFLKACGLDYFPALFSFPFPATLSAGGRQTSLPFSHTEKLKPFFS